MKPCNKLYTLSKFKSRLFVFAVSCGFLFALMAFEKPKADFSGVWQINLVKSDFGKLNPADAAPQKLTVLQFKDSIVINKYFMHSNGNENSYFETFFFDGRTSERLIPPDSKRVTTLKWSDDKNLEILANTYVTKKDSTWQYHSQDQWMLNTKDNSLIIARTLVMPDRTEIYRAVYTK